MKPSAKGHAKRGKADYGIDAPGVIRACALVGVGSILSSRLIRPLRRHAIVLRGVRPALVTLGAASLGTAASMLAYGLHGKLTFRDRMLAMIDWRGDEKVLDVGTGRGLLMIGAAKRLTTGTATGVDIRRTGDRSGNSIGRALHNAEIEGVRSKVRVLTEDVSRLSFADNAFDVVLSTLFLHNVVPAAERKAACGEIARVLKPGGTALISDYTATTAYVTMLAAAGLIVERSRPYVRDSFTYLRVVAATKPLPAVSV